MSGPYWVRMTDRFFSGWGEARGKVNVFLVRCDTEAQADAIRKAAEDRPEMSRVAVLGAEPRAAARQLVSRSSFAELGAAWKGYYRGEPA